MGANESMYSRLVLGLSGSLPEHAEFQPLFELIVDALDEKNDTKKAIALATVKLLSETRMELCDGSEMEGEWCEREDGWLLVMRDLLGNNLFYHPEVDEIIYQQNFYK